jgi:hypothetical protein
MDKIFFKQYMHLIKIVCSAPHFGVEAEPKAEVYVLSAFTEKLHP